MKAKLYKLALWYIGKCNAEWEKRKFTNELKSLDRLTYWNFGKYMLTYGADAEWQKFSRYEVLDNAIQKLADYENAPTAYDLNKIAVSEQEIRNKAVDEFAERLKTDYVNFDMYYILQNNNFAFENTSLKSYQDMIDEIAKEIKGGAE